MFIMCLVSKIKQLCGVWKWENVGRWAKETHLTNGLAALFVFFCFNNIVQPFKHHTESKLMDRDACVALEGGIKERCRSSSITNVNAIAGKKGFQGFLIGHNSVLIISNLTFYISISYAYFVVLNHVRSVLRPATIKVVVLGVCKCYEIFPKNIFFIFIM